MNIRDESPSDVVAIERLTEAAFRKAPHSSGTEQFIVNALRKAEALSISLVAETDGEIVGHVALSPVSISDGGEGWYGIGPISVAPERQGEGIGSQLMRQALAALESMGATGCVLVGDPSWYERFGFEARPELVYPGAPTENFLVLSFGSPMPRGEASFHKAFDAKS